MCIYSLVAEDWSHRLPQQFPFIHPWINPSPPGIHDPVVPGPTWQEVEDLRQEVEHFKKLLKAAKIYDEESGQPDCEMDEKIAFLKQVAEFIGVDLSEVLPKDAE